MADAAKGLPVTHLASNNQLLGVRQWHERQIEFLDHNKGKSRDQKGITRSNLVILTIDHVLSGAADGEV